MNVNVFIYFKLSLSKELLSKLNPSLSRKVLILTSVLIKNMYIKIPLPPQLTRNFSIYRYNTYTIQPETPATKLTPKQRRQADRDRYSTRTIVDDDNTLVNHETYVVTDDSLTIMSGNNSEIEDLEMDDEPPRATIVKPVRPVATGASPVSRLQQPRPVAKTNIPMSKMGGKVFFFFIFFMKAVIQYKYDNLLQYDVGQ